MTKAPSALNAQLFERSAIRASARWWPRNPYVQALLMYPRRWVFRVILLWMALQAVLAMVFVYKDAPYYWENREWNRRAFKNSLVNFQEHAPADMAAIGAVLALFVLPGAVAVAAHVRDRVTDWRGTVTPRYRTPHILVGALLTASAIVYVACMFWVMQPFSLLGLLATAACLAAVGGCCAALPPKGVAIVSLAAVAAVSLPEMRAWMAYAACGLDETRAALILFTGLAALGGLWTWLALEHRERTPAKPEDLMLAERVVRWRRRTGEDVTTMSLARWVRLWRLPSSTGLMPAACGAGLLLLILLLLLSDVSGYSINLAVPLAGMSVILPVCAVATQWARRLPGIGYEMTRPASRRRSVRALGLAMAADMAAWWAWLTAGGVAGIVISATWFASNNKGSFDFNPWLLLATAVLASAAIQVALYGLIAWIMRFQTAWAVYLTALMAAMLCWIPLPYILGFRRQWVTLRSVELIAALALAGLLLAADAYRRWLRADIH